MDALSLLTQFLKDKDPLIQMRERRSAKFVGVVAARIIAIHEVTATHIVVETDSQTESSRYYDFKTE